MMKKYILLFTTAIVLMFSGYAISQYYTTSIISTGPITAGDLTIDSGSITDTSGAISFGNENLSTTGTLGSGATTVTSLNNSDGDITNVGSIALDSITADAGAGGSVVVNESGSDIDFRVEGSGAANALVVQGSDGYIGIGTASPSELLEVSSTGNTRVLVADSDDSVEVIMGTSAGTSGFIGTLSNHDLRIGTGGTYMMHLDHADGYIGIGTTNPTSPLQVVGIPIYANNAAAVAGGLTAGALYRTGGDPDPVCVVH